MPTIVTNRQTNRQTDRPTDRQTNGETDRRTDRHTHIYTDTEINKPLVIGEILQIYLKTHGD